MRIAESVVRLVGVPLAAAVVVGAVSSVSLGAPTIFTDRAAFEAATGASSATGPIPDVGEVVFSGSPPYTLGSVTFELGPGGDNIAFGGLNVPGLPGGDWYPDTPGNDIALGIESMIVTADAPVYAMGFVMYEPDATLPPWGGVAQDSTYEITVSLGGVPISTFTINAPDDVEAFVGVWAPFAFDSLTIVDITGGVFVDDDEYFGEFLTGTTPSFCPGDVDGDLSVGLSDIAVLIQNWTLPVPPAPMCADLDGSGSVGLGDVALVIQSWATSCR